MEKILITKGGRKFYVSDNTKDYHCQYGMVKAKELGRKDGSLVKTNTGKELYLLSPDFIDRFEKIKRQAQIIPLKDIAMVIAYCGITRSTTVLDAGTGSGAMACYLAHIADRVVSCDIREDHLETAKKNKLRLGLENLELRKSDITNPEEFDELYDVVTLDIPNPWDAMDTLKKVLLVGGYCVSYSPCIPQVIDFVNALPDNFIHLKTIEIIEREWEVGQRKVRPKTTQICHSGFLSIIRKISD